jgi:hypothetical protein
MSRSSVTLFTAHTVSVHTRLVVTAGAVGGILSWIIGNARGPAVVVVGPGVAPVPAAMMTTPAIVAAAAAPAMSEMTMRR